MKFNWGTGIVLAFIGFISFIMYFIISMNTNDKYNHDLVTEDYYKQELEFQNEINKETNAKSLTDNIQWKKTDQGLIIIFPETLKANSITGKVFLYRPSNKQLDFEIPILISNTYLLVPEKRLVGGHWNITVFWNYNNKDYIFKKELDL